MIPNGAVEEGSSSRRARRLGEMIAFPHLYSPLREINLNISIFICERYFTKTSMIVHTITEMRVNQHIKNILFYKLANFWLQNEVNLLNI